MKSKMLRLIMIVERLGSRACLFLIDVMAFLIGMRRVVDEDTSSGALPRIAKSESLMHIESYSKRELRLVLASFSEGQLITIIRMLDTDARRYILAAFSESLERQLRSGLESLRQKPDNLADRIYSELLVQEFHDKLRNSRDLAGKVTPISTPQPGPVADPLGGVHRRKGTL